MSNPSIFNKSDYRILGVLQADQCLTEISSYSIKQISEKTNLSIPKIRLVLKSFLLMNLVQEGAKDGISKTFYISEKGIGFLGVAMHGTNNENNEEE
jgi:DNA-binding transcriptional regulator GbsR (MarR family)